MQIRMTKKEDLPMVMDIIYQAQNSLKKLGVNQWQNGYPNENSILSDIENSISYVLVNDREILATIALSFLKEPTYKKIFNGTFRSNEPYGVIHRLAVDPSYKRCGLAKQLISFAIELCQNNNLLWLRVDTHDENIPMQHFLIKQGFQFCGTIYLSAEHNEKTKRLAYDYQIK